MIDEKIRRDALLIMRERFDRRDAITLLSAIDDTGVDRGTIGQCVHALIDTMANTLEVMESIAIDQSQNDRIRHSSILFSASAAQSHSIPMALAALGRIRPFINDDELSAVIDWLEENLLQHGYVSLY